MQGKQSHTVSVLAFIMADGCASVDDDDELAEVRDETSCFFFPVSADAPGMSSVCREDAPGSVVEMVEARADVIL